MPRITISYRRDDSLDVTGRIFDRLAAHFGRESVFRDIDNIPLGVDFRRHLDVVLDGSDIIIAIVGPQWIGPSRGLSRLAHNTDPVRVEIEIALKTGKPLIPVLVSRALMPSPEQLPKSLQEFAYRNAPQVDSGQDFDVHLGRLIRAMERILEVDDAHAANRAVQNAIGLIDAAPSMEGGPGAERHAGPVTPSPIERAARRTTRWPLQWAMGLSVIAMLAMIGVGAWWILVEQPAEMTKREAEAAEKARVEEQAHEAAAAKAHQEELSRQAAVDAAKARESEKPPPPAPAPAVQGGGQEPQAAVKAPSPPAAPPSLATETVFWQSIAQSSNPADFEEYLRQFPQGQFAGLARNHLALLRHPLAPSNTTSPPNPAIPNTPPSAIASVPAVVAPRPSPSMPGGTVWDFRSSLSTRDNPSGAWTIGVSTPGSTSFVRAVNFERDGLAGWRTPVPRVSDGNPSLLFNSTTHILELAGALPFQPGEFGVHPAPGEDLVLRFTAPTGGIYDVSATFWIKQANGIFVIVRKGDQKLAEGTTKPSPFSFTNSLTLTKGDSLDFVISLGPFAFNSNTTSGSLVIRGRPS